MPHSDTRSFRDPRKAPMQYLLAQYDDDYAKLFTSKASAQAYLDDILKAASTVPTSWDWLTDETGALRQIYTRDLDDAATGYAPGIVREIDFVPCAGPSRLARHWDLDPDGTQHGKIFPHRDDPTPIGYVEVRGRGRGRRETTVLAVGGEDWVTVPGIPEAVSWLHGYYAALARTCD